MAERAPAAETRGSPERSPAARPSAPSAPAAGWGKDRIFVSYRHDDSGYVVDDICRELARHFGAPAIFKDVDSIPPGVNFKRYLTDAVQRCDVLLAVIGRDWLERAADGATRLADARDFVRIELEAALERGIPLIPVMVRGASIPKPEDLPESLAELPYFNGVHVRRAPDFERDVERLRATLEGLLARGA